MAVYVDIIQHYPTTAISHAAKYFGVKWCHMFADSEEELHMMAQQINLSRRYFQNKPHFKHYDLIPTKRALAILYGAKEKPLKEWLKNNMKAFTN